MVIVGFSFTKISGEKKAPAKGQVKINNNVGIKDVQDANISMAKDKKGLRVHFVFDSKFDPDVGGLELQGDIVILEETKQAEKILKEWKAKKELPKELMPGLLNHLLERSNVQALILARDLGLPAPIPLPKVNIKQPTDKKAKK